MAKYDKETKFYWLQLKEDFFDDDAIQWLEEQQPNGRDYAYFYLKLCLKSLKSNGILIRKVGDLFIPYDNKKLAELTKIDFDTVTIAMELLKKIGLIKVLNSGEIYLTQLENLIGSVSKSALKKQQQRELKRKENNEFLSLLGGRGGHLSTLVSTKDKDKDKDKDRIRPSACTYAHACENDDDGIPKVNQDQISTLNENIKLIEDNFLGRPLSPIEYEEISMWDESKLTQYAIKQAVLNNAKSIKYISKILQNYKSKGITSVIEAQKNDEKFQNKKISPKASEPEWFDKNIEDRKITEEERAEMEELLKEFK